MAETHPQPTGSQLGEIRRAGAQMKPVPHLVHFAQRLRVAMAAAEVKPSQLAQECGVSPQAVHKWMRGLCAMRASHLMVICKMTGANLDWLMTMEPVPLRADPPGDE